MSWALKRQLLYLVILLIFFGGAGYLIIAPIVRDMPTCADGKRNGDEAGIDCGGGCERACLYQVDEVSILWTRTFRVVPGRYNAVAYLENHNKSSAIRKIKYAFRFADENNVYIGKREGTTIVPPSARFAVFEPALNFGNSIPIYSTFEFIETPEWVQVPPEKQEEIKVQVSDIVLVNESTAPRMSATIRNNSFFILPEIDVVAILYDDKGNAVSASRTYLERLGRGESVIVNFTWPEPLPGTVIAREVIPIFDIFRAELQ